MTEELLKLIQENEKNIKLLNETIDKYKRSTDNVLDSYHALFNNILTDYELKPKGVLMYTHKLCQELLDFFVKVCDKYNLEYWLSYGNLLGAVRHNGFIPWDDDVDVCMMRKDCLKFIEIIDSEIKNNDLNDIIEVTHEYISENNVRAFTQILIKVSYSIYAGLDIFPYDYIVEPKQDLEKQFKAAKIRYHSRLRDGMDKKEIINKFYEEFNLSYEKQNYILPSIEGDWGGLQKILIFETDKIFPLNKIKFNDTLYNCPNDYEYYLNKNFGEEYMKIPKIIHQHTRMDYIKSNKYSEGHMKNCLEKMKKVNANFE